MSYFLIPYETMKPGDILMSSEDDHAYADEQYLAFARNHNENQLKGRNRITRRGYNRNNECIYFGEYLGYTDMADGEISLGTVDYWKWAVVWRPDPIAPSFANERLALRMAAYVADRLSGEGSESDAHLEALTALYDKAYPNGEGEPSYRK